MQKGAPGHQDQAMDHCPLGSQVARPGYKVKAVEDSRPMFFPPKLAVGEVPVEGKVQT